MHRIDRSCCPERAYQFLSAAMSHTNELSSVKRSMHRGPSGASEHGHLGRVAGQDRIPLGVVELPRVHRKQLLISGAVALRCVACGNPVDAAGHTRVGGEDRWRAGAH
uniref:Uncharacterized protein n=1 Tax=Prymnesium polylepis TaxID=72548 RepID=A0A7S4MYT0_9EUKA|mmetsp:Transcript_9963/g.26534  ORF Transcript_9963/g.26534 Transcript_9963/m.26534 type:complete len:108 (-) Transcript_9963:101-424(-)